MEPIRLFKNLADCTGENAVTEALAATLKGAPKFRREFLKQAQVQVNGHDKPEIETRPSYPEGIPDLQITLQKHLIFFEVKLCASLASDQWNKYQRILDKQTKLPNKRLIGIAPWKTVHADLQKIDPKPEIWQWSDVWKMADKAAKREKGAVAKFLLEELKDLLEDRGMKAFDCFSHDDIAAMRRLHAMNAKLNGLFTAVVDNLGKLLSGCIVKISKGGYRAATDRDDQELYAGIEIEVTEKRRTIFASIDCVWSVEGPTLWLSLWCKGTRATESLREILEDLDFQWYGADGYGYRQLSSKLNGGSGLEKRIAEEVKGILLSVSTKLNK